MITYTDCPKCQQQVIFYIEDNAVGVAGLIAHYNSGQQKRVTWKCMDCDASGG